MMVIGIVVALVVLFLIGLIAVGAGIGMLKFLERYEEDYDIEEEDINI
jgi:hypothetical protein